MTTARDSQLQALFAAAKQEFDAGHFRSAVMARVDGQRRRTLILWSLLGLVALAALAVLADPVVETLRITNQVLPVSLVDIETDWLRKLASPVNSIAAAIAVGTVAIHRFFRWIFR